MIPNKETFLRLSSEGKLGNYLEMYNSYQEIPGTASRVTVRNKEKDSPFFEPNIPVDELWDWMFDKTVMGMDPNFCYFQEVPHSFGCIDLKCHGCGRLLNGQVMRNEKYVDLIYGTKPDLNLRYDLDQYGKFEDGIIAVNRLKSVGAWNELNSIWDEHPNDIIEFTVFDRPVGAFRTNVIIWEVRNY